MTSSQKPYLIRGLYEWCLDNGFTPYLSVWVNEFTRVPAQFVQDNQITLSISQTATKDLVIDNEWINFHARFGGVSHEIWVPVGHVMAIFSKETGEGMGFEVEIYEGHSNQNNSNNQDDTSTKPAKKGLKLVK